VDPFFSIALKPGQPEDKRIALVLERKGFAHWSLTEIRLPALQ
jgi:hypothetical protein